MSKNVEKLQKVVERLLNELPGCLALGITDNESGMVVAGMVNDPNFNIDAAGAYFTDAYLKAKKAVDIVGGGLMSELLISSNEQINMMNTLKGGQYHIGISVRSTAQLGMVRVIYKKFLDEIEKLLP
jgi:predicted regulator of Ras-like GTPase activity (Roadblock/LC7/MglB family)